MGDLLGFLLYPRQEPGYRPAQERLKDFLGVELNETQDHIHQQAGRCMECGTPFCHAFGCPIGNVIPELNDLAFHGRWTQAADLLRSTNNFPEFTGRICPAPCEAACVAGIQGEAVTVRQIELAIVENGYENGFFQAKPPAVRKSGRVAVIGSGPAGLTVADCLNRAGYRVTVYDNAKRPGGILCYGIPDFKLEKWVIKRRIDLMEQEGIHFEMEVRAGEDISYRFLKDRYEAVCLACGAREPRDLLLPGRELRGIHFAMDYLTQQNKRNNNEPLGPGEDIGAGYKKVVILGGGDTGSDCLGTALRQGAAEVHQLEILPEPGPTRHTSTPWPLWPLIRRKTHAHEEGGERLWSVTAKAFQGQEGVLQKVLCCRVEWECDAKGLPLKPHEKPGTEFTLEADLVLLALGFAGPRKNRLVEDLGMDCDAKGHPRVHEGHMTSIAGIFLAGDMRTGQSLVSRAIADGRKAAEEIKAFLG